MTTANQSEAIERAALSQLQAAAPRAVAERLNLSVTEIGGALVSVAGALPDSAIVVNRAIGFGGTDDPAAGLAEIQNCYETAGVGRYFLSLDSTVDQERLAAPLAGAGLNRARAWQKFARGTEAVPEIGTDLDLRRVGPEHGDAFGRIVAEAFDLGIEAAPWLASMTASDGWHVFMSFAGDLPAGVGALYIRDGLAWTDFGATSPEYRRRGSQGALLALRLRFALEQGCKHIFTCTGEAAPGDEQHSYRNILRMGFRKDNLRPNYAPG